MSDFESHFNLSNDADVEIFSKGPNWYNVYFDSLHGEVWVGMTRDLLRSLANKIQMEIGHEADGT